MPTRPRLCIFVIAYYAEATLKQVLERIPADVFAQCDCEILVVDDASEDRTFEIGREYQAAHPDARMTVLRNEHNQGYGGNQKVGYAYAIAEGFDVVAMVHGDGQYAPEELPKLLQPLLAGQAEAVFGSRMMSRFGALKGGMPLYKFVGNRILSTAQNALLGTNLSEFHSGYRLYSVEALKRLPFHLNSNDFHFDTEIILQLHADGARMVELPIPTYYGDEISRVNGMRYAKDVMLATLRLRAHSAGILYQRKFDTNPTGHEHYAPKLGYLSSHTAAIDAVPRGSRVLDIGSGPAHIARELLKKGCDVTVVDRFPIADPPPRVRTIVRDLDQPWDLPLDDYDVILLLDVIEHLQRPEAFLESLRAKLDYRPRKIIISVPNIAFFAQRLMLAAGQFNYGKSGILDMTHTRLFAYRSLKHLLQDAGMRIQRVRGIPAPFPKVLGEGLLGRAAVAGNEALIRASRSLFSYQLFVEAETTPDVGFVLRDSKARAAALPTLNESSDAQGRPPRRTTRARRTTSRKQPQ